MLRIRTRRSTVPSINKLLGSLFTCILVDEFQDTKEIQYAILAAILKASGARRTFLVGDPNQAIYGSLGGFAISAREFSALAGIELKEMELSRTTAPRPDRRLFWQLQCSYDENRAAAGIRNTPV